MQSDLFDKIEDAERIQIYSRLFHALKMPFMWLFDLTLLPYWNRVLGFSQTKFEEEQLDVSQPDLNKQIEAKFTNRGLRLYRLLTSSPAEMKVWLDGPEGKMSTEEMWANLVSGKLTFRGRYDAIRTKSCRPAR